MRHKVWMGHAGLAYPEHDPPEPDVQWHLLEQRRNGRLAAHVYRIPANMAGDRHIQAQLLKAYRRELRDFMGRSPNPDG